MATLRLLALVQKAPGHSPGQRFRLEQWAPHLRQHHGIAIDFSPFESAALSQVLYAPGQRLRKGRLMMMDMLRRRRDLQRAAGYDAVIIYREAAALGPAIYERLLARRGVPLLYDFDDAIWTPVAGSPNGVFAHLRFPGKTAAICRLARLVTVGNETLARWARAHNPRVAVVPTSVDLGRCPYDEQRGASLAQPRGADEPFVVTWSGSHSTLPYLEMLREPLRRLGGERPVVLRVIANAAPRPFAGVVNQFVPWRAEDEGATLRQAHVGVMPLPDDDFARGKCGLKALLYMGCGVPAVVSPVGVNRDIVRPEDTGLWASTADEWLAALRRLASADEGAALRGRLARAGRRLVEQRYSAAVVARRYALAVYQALGRPDPAEMREAAAPQ